ncbi:MAG: hemolysin family protein [Clostridia bacterium]|nr:hemolysin family protein [Clostridia bacterium]
MTETVLIVLFVVFVILGAYFAGSESCFSAMNKIRMKSRAENDGDKKAKNAMFIANNFERALTTLLIGNNITHIAAASVATLYVTEKFADGQVSGDTLTLISTFVTTGIVFLFSEMIPKSFANDRADSMARVCAASLRSLMKLFSPLVAFFTAISDFFTKLFKAEEDPSITEDELVQIIETAEEQDVINDEQSDLLKSVLEFPEKTAEDVMTMRDDIVYLDVHLSNQELIEAIKTIPHSRIPIVNGSLDNVVGVLPIRKFLRAYRQDKRVDKRTVMLKPHFINCTDSIQELLDSMRQHKIYLGIVRDSDGKVAGVVTIEDFLEELVGEIWDEEDVVDFDFYKLGGNRFNVSASLYTADVFAKIGIPLKDRRIGAYTVGVWVAQYFGRLPEADESFIYENLEITIDKVSSTRVLSVIIHLLDEEDLEEIRRENEAAASEDNDRPKGRDRHRNESSEETEESK